MDGASRGVTVEGPVWSRHLGRFRVCRYEVRRWREGRIADVHEAVESPRRLSDDEAQARHVLALAESVPAHVWGRDELRISEMWNSNSVMSWLLTAAGLPAADIHRQRADGRRDGRAARLQPGDLQGKNPRVTSRKRGRKKGHEMTRNN
jgi:hypothetical protein